MSGFRFDPWAALKTRADASPPPNPANPPNRGGQTESGLDALGGLGEGHGPEREITYDPRSVTAALIAHGARSAAPAESGLAEHERAEAEADVWSAEDWRAFFAERAGIAEFTGGLPRAEAEARAYDCCAEEWLARNFTRSQSGRCLGCGAGHTDYEPLLPFGIDRPGFVWLHSRCWGRLAGQAAGRGGGRTGRDWNCRSTGANVSRR